MVAAGSFPRPLGERHRQSVQENCEAHPPPLQQLADSNRPLLLPTGAKVRRRRKNLLPILHQTNSIRNSLLTAAGQVDCQRSVVGSRYAFGALGPFSLVWPEELQQVLRVQNIRPLAKPRWAARRRQNSVYQENLAAFNYAIEGIRRVCFLYLSRQKAAESAAAHLAQADDTCRWPHPANRARAPRACGPTVPLPTAATICR